MLECFLFEGAARLVESDEHEGLPRAAVERASPEGALHADSRAVPGEGGQSGEVGGVAQPGFFLSTLKKFHFCDSVNFTTLIKSASGRAGPRASEPFACEVRPSSGGSERARED